MKTLEEALFLYDQCGLVGDEAQYFLNEKFITQEQTDAEKWQTWCFFIIAVRLFPVLSDKIGNEKAREFILNKDFKILVAASVFIRGFPEKTDSVVKIILSPSATVFDLYSQLK